MAPRIVELHWRRHGRDVVAFQREIYETNFPGFVADEQFLRDYGEQIRQSLGSPTEGLFVLEQDGRACGFLWLSLVSTMVDPHVGYIRNIYVAPDLRGEGHGRRLVEFAEEWCMGRGITLLALDASCCNERAVSLYRDAGFEVVRLRMEKKLHAVPRPGLFESELLAALSGDDPWRDRPSGEGEGAQ